jgi:hypothetical protein
MRSLSKQIAKETGLHGFGNATRKQAPALVRNRGSATFEVSAGGWTNGGRGQLVMRFGILPCSPLFAWRWDLSRVDASCVHCCNEASFGHGAMRPGEKEPRLKANSTTDLRSRLGRISQIPGAQSVLPVRSAGGNSQILLRKSPERPAMPDLRARHRDNADGKPFLLYLRTSVRTMGPWNCVSLPFQIRRIPVSAGSQRGWAIQPTPNALLAWLLCGESHLSIGCTMESQATAVLTQHCRSTSQRGRDLGAVDLLANGAATELSVVYHCVRSKYSTEYTVLFVCLPVSVRLGGTSRGLLNESTQGFVKRCLEHRQQ